MYTKVAFPGPGWSSSTMSRTCADEKPAVTIAGISNACKEAVGSPFNIFSLSNTNKLSPPVFVVQ